MAVFAIPAIGVVWLLRRIRVPKKREKEDEYTKQFRARLRSPDFSAIEENFGIELPSQLKDFYASDFITDGCDLKIKENEWSIAFFEPLDSSALRESWPASEDFISIANDGCGNEFIFSPKKEPYMMLFHDHETGKFEDVGVSLQDFLSLITKTFEMEGANNKGSS